jgi:hypothetical protein
MINRQNKFLIHVMKIMSAILFLICRNRIIVVYFKNQPEESSMSNKIERHLRNGAPNLKD